jgi:hypothetical protein
MGGYIVNNELMWMWDEVALVFFKVQTQNLHGEAEDAQGNLIQGSRPHDRDT